MEDLHFDPVPVDITGYYPGCDKEQKAMKQELEMIDEFTEKILDITGQDPDVDYCIGIIWDCAQVLYHSYKEAAEFINEED